MYVKFINQILHVPTTEMYFAQVVGTKDEGKEKNVKDFVLSTKVQIYLLHVLNICVQLKIFACIIP